jgi:hypothetical protein
LVSFHRLNASQLSDFGRPRASNFNDTLYESEITTARLRLNSRFDAESNRQMLLAYTPGGPSKITFSASERRCQFPSGPADLVAMRGQVVEVEVFQGLDLREVAVRIRMIVPADSRSATWRCSSAARYSSCDQFSSRAWPYRGIHPTRIRPLRQ